MAETPSNTDLSGQALRAEETVRLVDLIRSDTLIRTKLLVPQVQVNWVERPRLDERLEEGLHAFLTLVSAPAGFGKTSLLAGWVRARIEAAAGKASPFQCAWLSLDERDNDPLRFLTYLVAALQSVGNGVSENLLLPLGLSPHALGATLAALINDLAGIPGHFALILDDVHLIRSPEVYAALDFLLAHLPPQMHLFMASRSDPPLPLARLRARGQMVELRAADLRFDTQEAETFLVQKMSLPLSPGDLLSLEARTEGWPAGLQLAALAIRQAPRAGRPLDAAQVIRRLTGTHRYIVDYLADQVLSQQPGEVQAFLLQTSILERMCAPLCEALLENRESRFENSQTSPELHASLISPIESRISILDYLERANLFILPLDDERCWYRYHPLFAEFLRARLRQVWPGRWAELHRRAIEWYERSGFIAEAVDHALAAGQAEDAMRLVEQVAESFWMKGEMVRLLGWLEALPDRLIQARPRLCILYAWILNIAGDFDAAERQLQAAARTVEADPSPEAGAQAVTRGMLAATQAILAAMQGQDEWTFQLSQQALDDLPAEEPGWRSVARRNLGIAHLLAGRSETAAGMLVQAFEESREAGSLYMELVTLYELAELQIVQGQLHRAAETLYQALEIAAERSSPGLTISGAIHVGLSEVLREWNDLEAGERHARLGIEEGRRGKSLGIQVCGYTRLGRLALALGQAEAAAQAFQRAIRLAPIRRRTSFIAHHEIQAYLWEYQGDPASAQHWLQSIGLRLDSEIHYLDEAACLTLASQLIEQSAAHQALDLLERLCAAAQAGRRLGRLIEARVLQARACDRLGEERQAARAVQQALVLAAPQGYVRVFVDEGEYMRKLLHRIAEMLRGTDGLNREDGLRAVWEAGMDPQVLLGYVERLLATFRGTASTRARKGAAALSLATSGAAQPLEDPISERELDILRLVAAGLSNQEVAHSLYVAPSTIHWHLKNIYSKLNVHSRTQAIARAAQMGLLA